MAAWVVVCTNSHSKIVHSQVPKHGLAEFLLPSRPTPRSLRGMRSLFGRIDQRKKPAES
jgi:hypothetical protein